MGKTGQFAFGSLRRDAGLLVAFHVIMTERNATRAAQKLLIGQPAVSNILSRLRELFDDPLFTRVPEGLEPTRRATELHAAIGPLIEMLSASLEPSAHFDPASSRREFRIMFSDYWQAQHVPGLTNYAKRHAPDVSFDLIPLNLGRVAEALDRNEVDLVVTNDEEGFPDWVRRHRLFNGSYVCWYNPAQGGPPDTLAEYEARRHVKVQYPDLWSPVNDAVERLGIQRRIAATVNSYYTAVAFLIASDMVITGLEFGGDLFRTAGLASCPPPFDIIRVPVVMCWHERRDLDPASTWLRQALIHVNAEVSG